MSKNIKDAVTARGLLINIVKRVRKDTGELQQEIINPLEAAIYALGELIH